jgi:tRNA dimethylallyltransferase
MSIEKIPDTKYQIQNTDKILVILGPTSSGKSDIAIKLAKKFDGEIISADSRQIYRGMDIGTGKVPKSKVQGKIKNYKNIYFSSGIPHHMIDIISPRTDYNVTKFKHQAEKIIEDILHREKLPIICGGTGFWIQAIVDDVNFPEVKPDWKMREKLEKHSAVKLFTMLKKLDPDRAKSIDQKNKVRLIRAIEICKTIGKVPNVIHDLRFKKYEFLQLGIRLLKEKLYSNIEKRVEKRFRQGMIDEVKSLHDKNKLSWKKIQSFGLAYFWIPLYFQNKITHDELTEKVMNAEKKYAKRQITWFKRDKRIKWLKNFKDIKKETEKFLI